MGTHRIALPGVLERVCVRSSASTHRISAQASLMGCVMTQLDEATTLLREYSAETAGVRASSVPMVAEYTYSVRLINRHAFTICHKDGHELVLVRRTWICAGDNARVGRVRPWCPGCTASN